MACARNIGGNLGCLVDTARLHQIEAAKLLFGLGERSVSIGHFAVAHTHGLGCLGGLQGITALDGPGKFLAEVTIGLHFGRVIAIGVAPLITVDQQKILHINFLLTGTTAWLSKFDNSPIDFMNQRCPDATMGAEFLAYAPLASCITF